MTQLGLSIELHTALLIASIAVVWVVCGVFAFGLTLAYFQKQFPALAEQDWQHDRRVARILALWGPLGVLIAVACGDIKHGLMFRNPKRRET
jgi:hypothetical protein